MYDKLEKRKERRNARTIFSLAAPGTNIFRTKKDHILHISNSIKLATIQCRMPDADDQLRNNN